MKRKYHFKFNKTEGKNFEQVIKGLGLKVDTKIKHRLNMQTIGYDYMVALSKYELLYVGLSCKSGEYSDVTDHHEKALHFSTGQALRS